jgi:hypothetical protein
MTVAVVIELSPADASSPYARALLDTCNIGMHSRARCILEQDSAADDQGIAVAILTWDGPAHSEARIEVGLRIRAASQWQDRRLTFSSSDPETERWKTAGFAIATLVGEAVARDETARAEDGARKETTAPTFVSPVTSSIPSTGADEPARLWLDAQFVVAGGASGFLPGQGGGLRFSQMPNGDRWFVTGGVQCTVQLVQPDDISVVRPGVSTGGGVVVLRLGNRVRAGLRVDAFLQLIEVTGRDSATGSSGSGGRWVAGLGEGADLAWMWSRNVGVVAGAVMTEAIGPTEIRAHGRAVASIPWVDFGAEGGLRLTFR